MSKHVRPTSTTVTFAAVNPPTSRARAPRESATRDLPPEPAETHDVNAHERTRAHTRRSHEHTQTDAERTRTWLSDSPRPRASRRSRPARALPPVAPPPRRRRSPLARSVTPRAFSPAMPSSPTPSSVAVMRASPTPARAVASSWRPRLRGTSSSRSRRGRRRRRRPSVRRSVPRCVVFSLVFFYRRRRGFANVATLSAGERPDLGRVDGWVRMGERGCCKDLVEGLRFGFPKGGSATTGGGRWTREMTTTTMTMATFSASLFSSSRHLRNPRLESRRRRD